MTNTSRFSRKVAPVRRRVTQQRLLLTCIVTFAAYVAVVQLFPVVSVPPENVALLWLPNAVVVVALLRTERRWWWSIWIAGFLAEIVGDAFQGIEPRHAAWFGAVNMLESTALAVVVQRFGGPGLMRTARSVAVFLAAAIAVPALTGMLGALGSVIAFDSEWIDAWPSWWFGDAIGIAVGVPVGLALFDLRASVLFERPRAVRRGLACAGLAATAAAVALLVDDRLEPSQHVAIATAVILALGLGALGSAAGGTLVALVTIIPAVGEVGTLSVVESQGFLLVVTGAVLFVGAVIESEHTTVMALKRSEERFRTTFEDAPIGMAITDLTPGRAGRWLEVNASLARTLGRSVGELLAGDPALLLHPEDRERESGFAPSETPPGDHVEAERRYRHAEGHYVWCRVVESVVRDPVTGSASYAVTQLVDVTAMKNAAAELAHAAMHDALTGLPNRTLMMDRLKLRLAGVGRSHDIVAVIYIDLDRFKEINDSLGHAAGDVVLVEAARRLRSVVRPEDTVARLGGDEFAIVSGDIEDEAGVVLLVERIAAALNQPTTVGDRLIDLSGSIGVAMTRDAGHPPGELLRSADGAMYQAKAKGRRRVEFSGRSPLAERFTRRSS